MAGAARPKSCAVIYLIYLLVSLNIYFVFMGSAVLQRDAEVSQLVARLQLLELQMKAMHQEDEGAAADAQHLELTHHSSSECCEGAVKTSEVSVAPGCMAESE